MIERRSGDRRRSVQRRPLHLIIFFLAAGLLIWQWRFVVYSPLWLARRALADHFSIYDGKTNGIPNRDIVLQARNYITDANLADPSGNLNSPEALRPLGERIHYSWFHHYAPVNVDFDGFARPKGHFIVDWLYVPGCQRGVSLAAQANWFDAKGQPCTPLCRIRVEMTPDLRFIGLQIQ